MSTKYILTYEQPYEVDDDSPSGIGDHSICWSTRTACVSGHFTKAEAKAMAITFLNEGSIFFNHFTDGNNKRHYRKFVSFIRQVETSISISLVEIHRPIIKAALDN